MISQINLIVGDYFRTKDADFLKYSTKANELISWLRSKKIILARIEDFLKSQGRQPMGVIRPVPTRWTAFYLAYQRLLELRKTLEFLIA